MRRRLVGHVTTVRYTAVGHALKSTVLSVLLISVICKWAVYVFQTVGLSRTLYLVFWTSTLNVCLAVSVKFLSLYLLNYCKISVHVLSTSLNFAGRRQSCQLPGGGSYSSFSSSWL